MLAPDEIALEEKIVARWELHRSAQIAYAAGYSTTQWRELMRDSEAMRVAPEAVHSVLHMVWKTCGEKSCLEGVAKPVLG